MALEVENQSLADFLKHLWALLSGKEFYWITMKLIFAGVSNELTLVNIDDVIVFGRISTKI